MAIVITLPTLATVLITAAVDSINPCAIGVLILLVSTILVGKRKGELLKIGMIYIAAVYITYFIYGLGLISFMAAIPIVWAEYISIVVGLLVVFAGIIEIKDYFWYGEGFSLMIPQKYAEKIKEKMKNLTLGTVIFLGVFVASVELPCTGGPYLAITLLLSQNFDLTAFVLLIIYNIIFVMPLVVILFMVLLGQKLQNVQQWKQNNKAYMRLFTGLILISLGWLLILIANGVINLN
ncbi:GAP family protein [Candidatus Pacearchaeota archaeon]|nr:GAP family protein [Candidatus Pacearchaeota archaeon]